MFCYTFCPAVLMWMGGGSEWVVGASDGRGVMGRGGRWESGKVVSMITKLIHMWSHVINQADWTKCKTQMVAIVMWLIWPTLFTVGIWSDSDQIPLRNWSDWIRSDLLRKITTIWLEEWSQKFWADLIWSDWNSCLTDKTSGTHGQIERCQILF